MGLTFLNINRPNNKVGWKVLINVVEHSTIKNNKWEELTEEEKVKVRLKFGELEVEIECRQDQLKEVIDTFLSSLKEAGLPQSTPRRVIHGVRGEPQTCREVILELWSDGWFSSPRRLFEVDEEISRRGYHYNRSAIAHTLADLVREGFLTREGRKGGYRYLQKRPPG